MGVVFGQKQQLRLVSQEVMLVFYFRDRWGQQLQQGLWFLGFWSIVGVYQGRNYVLLLGFCVFLFFRFVLVEVRGGRVIRGGIFILRFFFVVMIVILFVFQLGDIISCWLSYYRSYFRDGRCLGSVYGSRGFRFRLRFGFVLQYFIFFVQVWFGIRVGDFYIQVGLSSGGFFVYFFRFLLLFIVFQVVGFFILRELFLRVEIQISRQVN